MSAPFVDPRESNPLAQLLSQALGGIGSDIQTFGGRAAQSGIPHALLQGASEIPQVSGHLLGQIPGAQTASEGAISGLKSAGGLGLQALIGERGKESLGRALNAAFGLDGAQGPNQTIDPTLALGGQSVDPQLQGAPNQSVGQGAISPQQNFQGPGPLNLPTDFQFPGMPERPPISMDSARDALGPVPEAQSVGQGEALSRLFGGQAAGGLQAIQNAPGGRAATLGEVIAGVGAGGAGVTGEIGAENRQFEEIQRQAVEQRENELSRISIIEETAKAARSDSEFQLLAQQTMIAEQMNQSNIAQNYMASLPVHLGTSGYWDPIKQVVVPPRQTIDTMVKNTLAVQEALEKFGTKGATVAGLPLEKVGMDEAQQFEWSIAVPALTSDVGIQNLTIDLIEAEYGEETAENVRRVFQNQDMNLGNDEASITTAMFGVEALMRAARVQITAMANGVAPEAQPFRELIPFIERSLGRVVPQTENQFLRSIGGF